jgi:rhodanese-related sulfurtransferase
MKRLAALAALILALVVCLLGERDPEKLAAARSEKLAGDFSSGNYRVHPAELLELMNNTSVKLHLLDLRDENEFNLFHLANSRRVELQQLKQKSFLYSLGQNELIVLVSNGEGRARRGWELLRVQNLKRVYILEGGINGWLEFFAPERTVAGAKCEMDDCPRYRFEAALGERHPESLPGMDKISGRQFPRRVKVQTAQKRRAGSCG